MGSGFESQGAHFKENPADSSESAGFLRSPRKRLEKLGGIDISPCSGVRCLEDGIRPRSYRGGVGTSHLPRLRGALHVSSAPTQGHPSPGRSALSLLRCGERPCDTLRALPENVAAPRGSRWARLYATSGGCVEVSVASVATSGCPKRSEGGCPCRSEEGSEPRANPAGWFVVWACAPCLANWGGGGLSRFSVLLGGWCFACRHTKARHRHTTAAGNHFKKS